MPIATGPGIARDVGVAPAGDRPASPPGAEYGAVLTPAELGQPRLPEARGTLSEFLFDRLRRAPGAAGLGPAPAADDDVLYGEDGPLALYCLYGLHYRGFAEVDDDWEWEPSLLAVRRQLETALLTRLRDEAGGDGGAVGDVEAALREVIACAGGRSLSRHLATTGTLDQFREYAMHRSLLQLIEADPHTWAIPRLTGAPKAALVEIQADEYGHGVERDMHQNLFAVTMRALELDARPGVYLDRLPGHAFATVNVPSLFGLHRRLRGALVGHLALFEMTSVEPMGAYAAALRRLGLAAGARHFFEVHVVADAHHRTVAGRDLAATLVAQDPVLAADVVFGALATTAVEGHCAEAILTAWDEGLSSLRGQPPAPR
ncbi:iron-containing redox enzyme family protein [Frankia gtarii]|uniref:iron-containing redox enzyme family protein n=1 Tax=Frankia gtarii TaxID=2950102 RepID=UPI0021C0ACDB|nr:iron-containing redox enzyme family protein [Frankia gtarii]